ncbi:SDR family NAD(P)-dependent oxidoreductase [Amycolatopsis australiensis]|uniref:3-oxoacyl-[acyl-carrier protein] reductase n=1 Tax=Amycolatopsis australiensis TaxID=546364 RepID=A0A1K1S748_9PSEU|nr:SDR family NAD(P)-dependent oxidoreductase [Amycolatopsis australiensis]SFW80150.1 3-oxoacyl-[acyl-carrier protein] reductase [Amycolatopsis australiensis]
MSKRFDGKVAMVNAAAGAGIGGVVARRLLAEGARVVVTDLSAKRLDRLQDELTAAAGAENVLARALDAADEAGVRALFADVTETFGQLDVLVNSVGLNQLAPFPDTSLENWNRVLSTSLTAHFLHARAAWPLLRQSASPAIVNVSSLAAESPAPFGEVAYAAAKAGVLGLTRALAKEGASSGIRANAVMPGLIWNDSLTKAVAADYVQAYREVQPLGRDGEPDEVADVILFLASPDSRHVTGQTIRVAA